MPHKMGSSMVNAISLDEEDIPVRHTRSRAMSAISIASSHTLRAESSDTDEFDLSRLSIQPQSPKQPQDKLGNGSHGQNLKRGRADQEERQNAIIIDDDDAEEAERAQKLDLLEAQLLDIARNDPKSLRRNLPIIPPFNVINRFPFKSGNLRPSKFVKLYDVTLFQIKHIIQNSSTGEITLRGWRYRKIPELVDEQPREYVLVLDIDEDDPRDAMEQCVEDIFLSDVERFVKVIVTNKPFPEYSNTEYLRQLAKLESLSKKYIQENANYVVRWKFITGYKDANIRRHIQANPNKWSSLMAGRRFEAFTEEECTPGAFMSTDELRYNFRDITTVLGGSFMTKISSTGDERRDRALARKFNVNDVPGPLPAGTSSFFDPDEDNGETSRHKKRKPMTDPQTAAPSRTTNSARKLLDKLRPAGKKLPIQTYTFGDGFCGAGGMTRGAFLARLKIIFGFDANSHAGASWTANFPYARFFQMWAHQFLSLPDPDKKLIVDILHLSPPCQFFAPCHTRTGRNDEMNTASLFSVGLCLEKSKPRIVTIEETFGLLTGHKEYFNALIRLFTGKGFSISWQIVKMEELGVPQERRRLFIIASCPGETLPSFIEPTHSSFASSPLPPFVRPIDVLNPIPAGAENHDIPPLRTTYTKWDPRKLVKTIICQGTISHFEGKRSMTLYEVKRLMGFPHEHVFRGGEVRKQIGNAVPPSAGGAVLGALKRKMLERDRGAGSVWSGDGKVCWTREV